jgi:hypothetical protein
MRHVLPASQRGHEPPQSTSVSSPSFAASSHDPDGAPLLELEVALELEMELETVLELDAIAPPALALDTVALPPALLALTP